jgi:hypothetical protein
MKNQKKNRTIEPAKIPERKQTPKKNQKKAM